MPEGDTIFRAARTLGRALSGQTVTRFETVFPHLGRIDDTHPIRGRTVLGAESLGKHVLIRFSGDLILRTHMRMNGSWHIYRPGERWRRPHFDMRIVIETAPIHAIGFSIPIAEFIQEQDLDRTPVIRDIGPDLLADAFDESEAIRRLLDRADMDVADALLDQRAVAGIGNVYKSEVLFAARVNPFTRVARLDAATFEKIIAIARRLMAANVQDGAADTIVTYSGMRRTTGRMDASERLWVYGRVGKPCRRCGTPVARRKQGPHARSTYWCPKCQPVASP